jgi:hypothetical protein
MLFDAINAFKGFTYDDGFPVIVISGKVNHLNLSIGYGLDNHGLNILTAHGH